MENTLREYELEVSYNDSQDADRIDFDILDGEEIVASVWGHSIDDVEWDCRHPHKCTDFGDKDEQCECEICGSYGDWHYEEDDEGHKVPEAHDWYPRRDVGGIIRECLEEMRERNGLSL